MVVQPNRSEAGLSLIEIMAALFIVGLTATFLYASVPSGKTPVETARISLTQQLMAAEKLARTTGEPYGVRLEQNSSTLMVFRRGEWTEASHIYGLSHVDIPDPLSLEKTSKTANQSRSRLSEDDETDMPQMWFDPTGIAQAEPYSLMAGSDEYTLTIEPGGDIDVSKRR